MATSSSIDLLPDVKSFLSASPLKSIIGGKEDPGHRGETLTTVDPGTGEKLADVYAMDAQDVDRAVKAADDAFNNAQWARLPANERGVRLHRLADLIEQNLETLAQLEALDCGKLIDHARGDIANFCLTLRYYTDLSIHTAPKTSIAVSGFEARTVRHPWGVCGFIFPWNFPFLLVGWNISPALAAGNTVVIKPAEDSPLSTLYLPKLVREAGIPDGVVNVVAGFGEPAGSALANHPGLKRMSFTGSPEVGKRIGEACGRNLVPVKLELGGKGAAVIFDDVDIDNTAEQLSQAITFHTGQVCCDATRWLVSAKIYDKFMASCTDKMSKIKIGHGFDAQTQMGPVVSEKQRKRVLGYLDKGVKEGAKAVLEGGPATVPGCEKGFYVKPAILEGALDNVAAREEIFGPVTYVARFDTEDQAIQMANNTPYGLANSVWSADLDRANRVADAMVAGNSWVNAHNLFPAGVAYAGVNLSGMGGGVNSPDTLIDYYRPLSVVRPL